MLLHHIISAAALQHDASLACRSRSLLRAFVPLSARLRQMPVGPAERIVWNVDNWSAEVCQSLYLLKIESVMNHTTSSCLAPCCLKLQGLQL